MARSPWNVDMGRTRRTDPAIALYRAAVKADRKRLAELHGLTWVQVWLWDIGFGDIRCAPVPESPTSLSQDGEGRAPLEGSIIRLHDPEEKVTSLYADVVSLVGSVRIRHIMEWGQSLRWLIYPRRIEPVKAHFSR